MEPLSRGLDGLEIALNKAAPHIRTGLEKIMTLVHRGSGRMLLTAAFWLNKLLGQVRWPLRLSLLFAILAGVCGRFAIAGPNFLPGWETLEHNARQYLSASGALGSFDVVTTFCAVTAAICLICVFLAFIRHRFSLIALKVASALFAVTWCWMFLIIYRLPNALLQADGLMIGKLTRDELWLQGILFWTAVAAVATLTLFSLVLGRVNRYYVETTAETPLIGDRIAENIQTHGRDPRWRTSAYWAGFLHIFVFLLPFLIRGCGWERAVPVPEGSGIQQVEVVKVKKEKKKKYKWLLAKNSPFIFDRLKIDESKVLEEVDEITENEYVAQELKQGKIGVGGGTKGGWPNGMPGKIRFIRLKYAGGDWDQDMGKGADYNFLLEFKKLTGFDIEDNTEAIGVSRLRLFPKHRGPPFVFLTGKSGISMSDRDIRTLRWYCIEEGGMIFADNGGGSFDSNFRHLIRRVFPDKQLIDIANDDPIFHHPYSFPSGAPPLWHHSGYRAMGIRHSGRWVVFYHQGDVNDAWKTGSSGASEAVANQAYKLGINIVNYAFTNYRNFHSQD